MHKLVLIENTECSLGTKDVQHYSTFIEMNFQIKSELGLRKPPLQLLENNKIKAEGIIGNIVLNDVNLIILPKFCSTNYGGTFEEKNKLHRLYIRALKCCSDKLDSTVYFSKHQIVDDDSIFIDVIAEYYVKILTSALKQSRITTYEEYVQKTAAIRGKVLIHKQLSEPITDAKTWCKFKQISRNNIYNQLLRWACLYLHGASSNISTKKKLANLAREFDCGSELLSKRTVSDIRLPRKYKMFTESAQLAKNLYLGNARLKEKTSANGNKINGYVINMEKAFENIICYFSRLASLDLGFTHKAQANMILAVNNDYPELDYFVRPDDLILYNDEKLIIDAKYKIVADDYEYRKKPNREDIYQMISNCIAYQATEAILLYPLVEKQINYCWKLSESVNNKHVSVFACSIDMNESDADLIGSICTIISNTTFYREARNDT